MIYIVVPCYNEAHRLPIAEFESYTNKEVQFLFVNDGSKDNTTEVLKILCSKIQAEYLSFEVNQGKAEIVRQGVLYLINNKELQEEDWIGFWDADLATPLYEIQNFVNYGQFYPHIQIGAIWGSRVYRLGAVIQRDAKRHYISRVFATIMYLLFKIQSYDSQCGAKLFKVPLAKKLFRERFVSRWIFDVEILLRAEGAVIIEYPLKQWIDVAGSKITLKEIFRIVQDIIKVYYH